MFTNFLIHRERSEWFFMSCHWMFVCLRLRTIHTVSFPLNIKLECTGREKQESRPGWGAHSNGHLKFFCANLVARKAVLLFCFLAMLAVPFICQSLWPAIEELYVRLMKPVWLHHLSGPGGTKPWQLRLGSVPPSYSKQVIWKQRMLWVSKCLLSSSETSNFTSKYTNPGLENKIRILFQGLGFSFHPFTVFILELFLCCLWTTLGCHSCRI